MEQKVFSVLIIVFIYTWCKPVCICLCFLNKEIFFSNILVDFDMRILRQYSLTRNNTEQMIKPYLSLTRFLRYVSLRTKDASTCQQFHKDSANCFVFRFHIICYVRVVENRKTSCFNTVFSNKTGIILKTIAVVYLVFKEIKLFLNILLILI